jgi:flagellar motor switch protein FliG
VLADAIHRTPVDTLASFLRGTEPGVRERVMEVAPSRKRDSLETELSLDVPVGKTEFLESRQAFMQTVRESARRDGVDLAKANSQVLGRNGNVSS